MSAFDRIIGYNDIKAELMMISDVLKNMDRYKQLGVTIPGGILLSGKPGIGKTLMAKCFIEESGCKSFTIRKDTPNGDFINQIRNTFAKAREESPSIVFMDDLDKFANEDSQHRDAEEYVAVQACIDNCKGADVFVLATINDPYCLPDSLTRAGRFDIIIKMEYPMGDDAKKIIQYYLDQKTVIGNVDLEEISRLMEGRSCAELETVINKAGIFAGFDRRDKIDQNDVLKACMRMIFDAPEAMDSNEKEYLKNIAVHEAGHAVVFEVLEPGSVNLVSVCHYSGNTEGITINHKSENSLLSIRAQEHEVIGSLGGKAATEIVFGVIDVGCNNDLFHAFSIVEHFVDHYCSYGFDSFTNPESSEFLRENKDRVVSKEMEKYYNKAKQIIAENRNLLDAITNALVEKKTLTHRDIKNIRAKFG